KPGAHASDVGPRLRLHQKKRAMVGRNADRIPCPGPVQRREHVRLIRETDYAPRHADHARLAVVNLADVTDPDPTHTGDIADVNHDPVRTVPEHLPVALIHGPRSTHGAAHLTAND